MKYPRRMMNLVTQIYTGHSILQKHLHIMKIVDDPTCEQCLEGVESVEHYLCECPAFGRPRYQIFGAMVIKKEELIHLSLRQILKFIEVSRRFEVD